MNKLITTDAKNEIVALTEFISKKIKRFNFSDIIIYKATVFAFGTLAGAIFSKAVKKLAWIIAAAAGVGAGYLIWKHLIDKD